MLTDDGLRMFTIYRKPRDYPGSYVVRACTVTRDGLIVTDAEPLALVSAEQGEERALEALRKQLPRGLARLVRADADDPVIVEVWL